MWILGEVEKAFHERQAWHCSTKACRWTGNIQHVARFVLCIILMYGIKLYNYVVCIQCLLESRHWAKYSAIFACGVKNFSHCYLSLGNLMFWWVIPYSFTEYEGEGHALVSVPVFGCLKVRQVAYVQVLGPYWRICSV